MSFYNLFANESKRNLEINIWKLHSQCLNNVAWFDSVARGRAEFLPLWTALSFNIGAWAQCSTQMADGFQKELAMCPDANIWFQWQSQFPPNKLQLYFNQSISDSLFASSQADELKYLVVLLLFNI